MLAFLGPRGPLIEPSSVRPSVRPPVRPPVRNIFPKFIDELKHCRQASGTPKTIYFLKADDVSYPIWTKFKYRDKYKDKYRDKYKYRDK